VEMAVMHCSTQVALMDTLVSGDDGLQCQVSPMK